MNRPSFQFYPADWTTNSKLRRCSWSARGVWVEILAVLHAEDEYGLARYPLAELCRAAGVPLPFAKELSAKGVLKGSDGPVESFIFTPSHGGQFGAPVTLIAANDGPCWYSSRLVRDEYIRHQRGKNSRFDGKPKAPPKPPIGYVIGGTKGDGPSSPSSSPSSSSSERERGFAETPPMSRKDFDGLVKMRAVPAPCAEWFWNTYDARNWVDATGQPVRKVEPLLMLAAKNWRANVKPRTPGMQPGSTVNGGGFVPMIDGGGNG